MNGILNGNRSGDGHSLGRYTMNNGNGSGPGYGYGDGGYGSGDGDGNGNGYVWDDAL